MRLPWSWGAADEEVLAAAKSVAGRAVIRAVTVEAQAPIVFRWLCQLKVAPYSYDLLDNHGRRSPRTLTPGADVLTAGEPVMRIFTLDRYVEDESLTLRITDAGALRLFGPVTVTYLVTEMSDGGRTANGSRAVDGSRTPHRSRLIGVLDLPDDKRPLHQARQWVLAWGDLFMMRKQLLTLRDLSQRSGKDA